ncbi:hypothetical protein CDAR_8971 [Caerostris darwini]|uniref:Uncharacterized protein n=1 Tax=Caerostris darwini TaxID=1538125 RepID=A0AAV4MBI9_9ARAC|nr:hypothetical protein CDAR_8971 [Caerostris darwini]
MEEQFFKTYFKDLELPSFQWIRAQNFEGGFGSSKHMDYEQSGRWYQWMAGPIGDILQTTPALWKRRILSKQIGLEFHSFFCLKAYTVPVTGDRRITNKVRIPAPSHLLLFK